MPGGPAASIASSMLACRSAQGPWAGGVAARAVLPAGTRPRHSTTGIHPRPRPPRLAPRPPRPHGAPWQAQLRTDFVWSSNAEVSSCSAEKT